MKYEVWGNVQSLISEDLFFSIQHLAFILNTVYSNNNNNDDTCNKVDDKNNDEYSHV